MKKIYPLIVFVFSVFAATAQTGTFCNANGNVVIFSNYDGGVLNINVDQNIPNLKIGIVSYEFARINISGAFVGNVTEVRWAGYNGSNNHCSLSPPYTTAITGVSNNVDTIIIMPAATNSNPNGYGFIICNYACDDSTNQGGCNTPDQIAGYFLNAFGGSLYFHYTQYGCWLGSNTYSISGGGNCCAMPVLTAVNENNFPQALHVSPNPSAGKFHFDFPPGISDAKMEVFDMMGKLVQAQQVGNSSSAEISLEGNPQGIYFLKLASGDKIYTAKLLVN